MTHQFLSLPKATFEDELHDLLFSRICDILGARQSGHCMSIADLDQSLMIKLAQSLRQRIPTAQIYILSNSTENCGNNQIGLYISSTKLVEQRNPMGDGSLRPPLLVFIPPNFHTNAEDSFNIASFEALQFSNIYEELKDKLLQQIPSQLHGYIREIFRLLQSERWQWVNPLAQTRFLLTSIHNGNDGETLGASLYELGLVPDFTLFADPALLQGRLQRNHRCVQALINGDLPLRSRVLNIDIVDDSVNSQLMTLLLNSTVEDPLQWTSKIVLDSVYWGLSFDKWKFSEELNPDSIDIEVTAIDLPTVDEKNNEEKLSHLLGSQILNPQEQTKIKVTFTVTPHPSQVQHLDYFTVQIISQDQGSIGPAKRVKAWQSKALVKNVNLDKLDKINLDDGWHFIRIQAWAEDGTKIPLVEEKTGQLEDSKRKNESELFYIVSGVELDHAPEPRAIPREPSLEQAKLTLQLTALRDDKEIGKIQPSEVNWSKTKDGQDCLEVNFGRKGRRQIPVFTQLKEIESTILETPEILANYTWTIERGKTQNLEPHCFQLLDSHLSQNFLGSRDRYFKAVSKDKQLISQAVDFFEIREEAFHYAKSYQTLLMDLKEKIECSLANFTPLFQELEELLLLDTVQINVTDFCGHNREALLLGPTHPLRVLWLATWAQTGQDLIKKTSNKNEFTDDLEYFGLLKNLAPLNIPFAFPQREGKVFISVDSLHPFWSLYAKADEIDPRGLLGEVSFSLKINQPGNSINSDVIAQRIARYLKQNTYISTLCINVFNPGQGEILVNILKTLQKHEDLSSLHYDLRLFALNPEEPSLGEALIELFLPNTVTGDIFSSSTGNHLFPKLNLAIHSIDDFRKNPKAYNAHLGILFDLFPAEKVDVSDFPTTSASSSPINGLIQKFNSTYHDKDNTIAWKRQPIHSKPDSSDEEGFNKLLVELENLFSGSVATITAQKPAFDQRLVISLCLSNQDRLLLKEIHDSCNWVFTIDRNLGIEFFDQGSRSARPPYIVDYIPTNFSKYGHNLIVTSRSMAELEMALGKVLEQYKIPSSLSIAHQLLDQLRALSGQLALKLLASPQQKTEVLGLALARLFLNYQYVLANQIVVPLDPHQNLFQRSKEGGGDILSLKRTDLALFNLNLNERLITCNLVEVKCYANVGGVGNLNSLKSEIAEQIGNSEKVLRSNFEKNDSLSYLLKMDDFAELLKFYLDRANRFSAIEQQSFDEAQQFLQTIHQGYVLRFSRSGLIFDFAINGTEPADYENGIEYHRIGFDLICDLVRSLNTFTNSTTLDFNNTQTKIDSVPVLTSAAFIAPRRNNLTSNSDLNAVDNVLNERHEQYSLNSNDLCQFLSTDEQKRANNILGEENQQKSDKEPSNSFPSLVYDVLLGAQSDSPQYGLLGTCSGRKVALDLNQTHTISLFGVQGSGKSYTLGSIAEMSCLSIPGINELPSPLATIIFHYSRTQDYKPEFTSMEYPNADLQQIESLNRQYGAKPQALGNVLILCPESQVQRRKAEYPNIDIHPIHFASSELQSNHWKFLMGAVGSQTLYMRQINRIIKTLQPNLTLDNLLSCIEESSISEQSKELARLRLEIAAEYINDSSCISRLIQPGRLVIVDLRDESIEKDDALGLFTILLQIFSAASDKTYPFNKLIIFDEVHKYADNLSLISDLVELIRQMRHHGTSIMVASQDPLSVPIALIELSSQIILHRFNSPAWLKHIQRANTALNNLSPKAMSQLQSGEAYVWSGKATDLSFSQQAVKVICRPRVTQHGGDTLKAVVEDTE